MAKQLTPKDIQTIRTVKETIVKGNEIVKK